MNVLMNIHNDVHIIVYIRMFIYECFSPAATNICRKLENCNFVIAVISAPACQLSPSLATKSNSDLRLQCLLLVLQNSSWGSWGPYNWAADRTPYLHCYWSELGQTLKVGWLGHLHELSTVLGTFVTSTFVHATFVLVWI